MANPNCSSSPTDRQILLKLDSGVGSPCRIDTGAIGNNGFIAFQSNGRLVELVGRPRELADLLSQLSQKLRPMTVAQVEANKLTPEKVIEYFENSPVLYVYADDVKAALAGSVDQTYYDVEKLRPYVSELLSSEGIPRRGYTRRAAEILFDDAGKNGGNNLTRIQAAIKLLTTTLTDAPTVIHLDKVAA